MELVLVIVGGAVAIAGGWVSEFYRSRWVAERDRAARVAALRERLDNIQRDTLLDLQVALTDWGRHQTLVYLADAKEARRTTTMQPRPDELDEAELEVGRRLRFLMERVKDDDLRRALTDLSAMSSRHSVALAMGIASFTPEALEGHWMEFTRATEACHRMLGETLRRYL